MFKINKTRLLIKLHYFLFLGALGPILPFYNVIGKQLQISEFVMGIINGTLPLLVLVAKPGFGYVIDRLYRQRKLLFLFLIAIMSAGFSLLCIIPDNCHTVCPDVMTEASFHNVTNLDMPVLPTHRVQIRSLNLRDSISSSEETNSPANITLIETGSKRSTPPSGSSTGTESVTTSSSNSNSRNFGGPSTNSPSNTREGAVPPSVPTVPSVLFEVTPLQTNGPGNTSTTDCRLVCTEKNLYQTFSFWAFVVCTSVGILAFNMVYSTSDAVCFDILGDGNEKHYGLQRMFGALGYGLTALGGGWAIDTYSPSSEVKDYTPAFLIVLVFGVLDLICCSFIRIPRMEQSKDILKDVNKVLKEPYVKSFLFFAAIAGMCEGMLIYSQFWFMEDLAIATHQTHNIKLLQGLTVATQAFFGEVIFFSFSDKILGSLGYGHCMTFSLFFYFIRLGATALVESPWWIIGVELVANGPTYALSYTTVVAYGAAIAPPGTSATMQGVMAGVNDGLGYALASYIGGILYSQIGGRNTFMIFAIIAIICTMLHAIVYRNSMNSDRPKVYKSPVEEKLMIELESELQHL